MKKKKKQYLGNFDTIGKINFLGIDFIFGNFTGMSNVHWCHLSSKITVTNLEIKKKQKQKQKQLNDFQFNQKTKNTYEWLSTTLLQKLNHIVLFVMYSICKRLFYKGKKKKMFSEFVDVS